MPVQEKVTSRNLSPKTILHDVSATFASPEHTTLIRKGMLFVSTPLEHATSADSDILREKHHLRTVVTTITPKIKRYIHNGKKSGLYLSEQFVVEDVLGLTLCRIHVRYGTFAKNVVNELPLWQKLWLNDRKFEYNAATSDRHDPELIRIAQDMHWNRDSIEDSFLVLVSSAPLIGRLFNEVLCKAAMYPLVIAGDRAMRDNTLIVFLLLLMLDVPFPAIESAHLHMTEGLPLRLNDEHDAIWAYRLQTAAWAQNRADWAGALRQRLEARYGSASGYFTAMGVKEATRNSIKDILLAPGSKVLVDIA